MDAPLSTQRVIFNEATYEKLAYEVARNQVGPKLDAAELIARLGIDRELFLRCCADPTFIKLVKSYQTELEENGVSFRLKAGVIAEDGLRQLYTIINDAEEPGNTRLKALEKAVEWADLKPAANGTGGAVGAGAPQIVFNFPPGTPTPANLASSVVIENDAAEGG